MTINWEEPFGLVMAEAGSCGTPVIAFRRGAVPEIVQDGLTGFVVDPKEGMEGLKAAYANLHSIAPAACRKYVEDHFTIEKMVDGYIAVYDHLIRRKQ
jgi:glycosyltransferase involved in cell wall biosynthesis